MTTSTKEKHAVPPRASRFSQPQQPQPDYVTTRSRPVTPVTTEPLPEKRQGFHFLTWFGVGMILAVALMAVWNMVLVPTFQAVTDQWQYGNSRVFSLDADVGHGGVSSFLAYDLNGHITIVEIVQGSPPTTRIYQSASIIGTEAEKRVITIQIADVNGDHKPDLIIHIEGTRQLVILYNNGGSFQWTLPQ